MRTDKLKAFDLRKQGKTYLEIERDLNVPRSTLNSWFKNEKWSEGIKDLNVRNHIKRSTEHMKKMNAARKIGLEKKYLETEQAAVLEFDIYKTDPLFMAGLMLYAGEGDKMTKGVIRLANIDFSIHRVFLKFIEKFLKIPPENVKLSILLYPDLNIEKCKIKWSQELNIPIRNFHKPQVIQGRSMVRRLHFGVGSTIISNSFLKKKLLKWVEMAKKSLSLDAAMV